MTFVHILMVHCEEQLRVESGVNELNGVSTSSPGKWDRAAQIHGTLTPPETQTKRQEVECKGGGSFNTLMACQSVCVVRVWWRWLQVLGGFSIPQPPPGPLSLLSLYSNNQKDWLRNPCHLPYHPYRPCLPCLLASPCLPWEAL